MGSLTAPSWGRFQDIRAVRSVSEGSNNGMKTTLEFRTVARTELGKDSSVMPLKGLLVGINFNMYIFSR